MKVCYIVAMRAEAQPFIEHYGVQLLEGFFAPLPCLCYKANVNGSELYIVLNGEQHGSDLVGCEAASVATLAAIQKIQRAEPFDIHRDRIHRFLRMVSIKPFRIGIEEVLVIQLRQRITFRFRNQPVFFHRLGFRFHISKHQEKDYSGYYCNRSDHGSEIIPHKRHEGDPFIIKGIFCKRSVQVCFRH